MSSSRRIAGSSAVAAFVVVLALVACVPAKPGRRPASGGLLKPGTISIVNGRGDSLVLPPRRGRIGDLPPGLPAPDPRPPLLPWPVALGLWRVALY